MKAWRSIFSKCPIAFIIAVVSFLIFSIPASASQVVKDELYKNNGQRNMCSAVEATIEQGVKDKDVVRTAIELGNEPCLMVKCAIEGGGNLKQIILGALEAGTTSDVVSRCAIDAGANSSAVVASLLQAGISLCYFEPEGLPYTPPEDTPAPFDSIPKPNPDPPFSPSTF